MSTYDEQEPTGKRRPWGLAVAVHLARGLWFMARARLILPKIQPRLLDELNRQAEGGAQTGGEADLVDIVSRVIPWLGNRLPWRSDCLVQAIAAQSWLRSRGIGSRIEVGIDRQDASPFESHAWLMVGSRVVTGGSIDRYVPILGSSGPSIQVNAPDRG